MADLREDIAVEMTLFGTIRDLNEISWRLNALVFGERPSENTGNKEPVQQADKLTSARNQIVEVNERLRAIADRLELIGK